MSNLPHGKRPENIILFKQGGLNWKVFTVSQSSANGAIAATSIHVKEDA